MTDELKHLTRRRLRAFAVLILGLLAVAAIPLVSAHAAEAIELTGGWNPEPPSSVRSGELVTGEFRVNLNDPETGADGSRDNMVVEISLEHGRFKTLPDLCLTG